MTKSKVSTLVHPVYRPDIDGLRALAVLSVVGFHAFPGRLPGGFVGVDIFFVISGFLISTIIFSNLERGQFTFFEFYSRRIRRIVPALLMVLATCLAFGWVALLAGEYRRLGQQVAGGAAFISNFILWHESGYFDIDAESKPLLHLWSLGIEEQFYIFWPLIMWVAAKARLSLFWCAIVVGTSSFLLNITGVTQDTVATFYSPQTRFWELAAGSVLAWSTMYRQAHAQKISARYGALLSLTGLGLIITALAATSRYTAFPGWWATLPVGGAVLVIAAGSQAWGNRVVLSSRVLVWIGLISFPLYLWHWPLLSFGYILNGETTSKVYRALAVASAVLLAWGTFWLIERPVRRSNRSPELVVGLLGAMIAVAVAGYLVYLDEGVPHRRVVIENLREGHPFVMESNPQIPCPVLGVAPMPAELCVRYAPSVAKKTIIVWGDSSAGAWSPVIQDIGYRKDYDIIRIMHLSCPPILGARKTRFDVPDAMKYCSDGSIQSQILDYIRALRPDLIMLIGAWNSYSPHSNREFITDRMGQSADPASTQRVMLEQLPKTLHALSEIADTLVFKSWPMMPSFPKERKVSLLGITRQRVFVPRSEFDADSLAATNTIDQSLGPRIRGFDPSYVICDASACDAIVEGIPFYVDRYHVTAIGAMQIAPRLDSVMDAVLYR